MGEWDKTVVDRALETDPRLDPVEPALLPEVFGAPDLPAKRGRGRPPGSRGKRAEEYAQRVLELVAANGGKDPLENIARAAGTDLLDLDELTRVAKIWGCTRFEAAKFIAKLAADSNPYLHQHLPRAIILNPGAPGAERVVIDLEDGEYREVARDDGNSELEPAPDDEGEQ